jgi:hypothetical protein
MRCLVCSKYGQSWGRLCKLCGMRSKRPAHFSGFYFCCDACANNFSNIISKTPADKIKEILEKEILI